MSANLKSPDHREALAASALWRPESEVPRQAHAASASDAIREFHVNVRNRRTTQSADA